MAIDRSTLLTRIELYRWRSGRTCVLYSYWFWDELFVWFRLQGYCRRDVFRDLCSRRWLQFSVLTGSERIFGARVFRLGEEEQIGVFFRLKIPRPIKGENIKDQKIERNFLFWQSWNESDYSNPHNTPYSKNLRWNLQKRIRGDFFLGWHQTRRGGHLLKPKSGGIITFLWKSKRIFHSRRQGLGEEIVMIWFSSLPSREKFSIFPSKISRVLT